MREDWRATTIGEICTVISGQSPNGKNYNDVGNGLPFYQGKKDFGAKYIGVPRVWTTQITKEAKAGDILISVRAPVGPINVSTEVACIGRGLAAIRASDAINREFLFYGLLNKQREISGNEGAVFPSINKKQIENIDFSLPPLPEQKRIVAILDEAFEGIDSAIANTEKNLANARELFTNRLSVIFTSPSDAMKEEWKTTSLDTICIVIAGQSPEGKNYNDRGEGLPFYQGKKDFGGKYVGPPRVWTTQVTKEARAGDILMSVRAPVGPINFAIEAACIGRGLAAIRAKTIVDRNFLFYGLLQKQPEISGNEGAVFASINKKQIENLDFPLPSISEQKRIVSEIDQLSAESQRLEDAYRRKIALFVDLKQSILHKAFSGELTTQPDRVLKETVA